VLAIPTLPVLAFHASAGFFCWFVVFAAIHCQRMLLSSSVWMLLALAASPAFAEVAD
jgi:hypothetical protein